jgi:hypothetical protein
VRSSSARVRVAATVNGHEITVTQLNRAWKTPEYAK